MSPKEIMIEHIKFWTSRECDKLTDEDIELVRKLAEVVGIKVKERRQLYIAE